MDPNSIEGKLALASMHIGIGKGAAGQAQQQAQQQGGGGEQQLVKQMGIVGTALGAAEQHLEEVRKGVEELRADLGIERRNAWLREVELAGLKIQFDANCMKFEENDSVAVGSMGLAGQQQRQQQQHPQDAERTFCSK